MHFAADKGNKEVIKLLIKGTGDISAKANISWALLDKTVYDDKAELSKFIKKEYIDFNSDVIPLYLAYQNHNNDIVELLRKAGGSNGNSLYSIFCCFKMEHLYS